MSPLGIVRDVDRSTPKLENQGGLTMNYNQNEKIGQITEGTMIVGIDIAKHKHVARAQDFRGVDFGRRLIFENSMTGFEQLMSWMTEKMSSNGKDKVIFGVEPTGHYWKNLAHYLKAKDLLLVVVNPSHVKKSKELDDNSPSKNDTKDARVIAQLVKDGRYSLPNLTEGVYAELRQGMKVRDQLSSKLQEIGGQIDNWLDRYFPEFTSVFHAWEGKTALHILEHFPLPSQIKAMNTDEITASLKQAAKRGVGRTKAEALQEAAERSVGLTNSTTMAKLEMAHLIQQYRLFKKQQDDVEGDLEALIQDIPGALEITEIKGVNVMTTAAFFAEVGDIFNYENPRQIQKLAGLSLRRQESGKYKGQTKISKRGRKTLRKILYLAVRPLVVHNKAFKTLHEYYTTRQDHPLKKQESLTALCTKLIRVFFALATKHRSFDADKMLNDIPQFSMQEAA